MNDICGDSMISVLCILDAGMCFYEGEELLYGDVMLSCEYIPLVGVWKAHKIFQFTKI